MKITLTAQSDEDRQAINGASIEYSNIEQWALLMRETASPGDTVMYSGAYRFLIGMFYTTLKEIENKWQSLKT